MKRRRGDWAAMLAWPAIVGSVVLALSVAVHVDESRFTPVTGKAPIESLLGGHTLKGLNFRFYYAPDGRLEGQTDIFFDRGRWAATATEYCEHWQTWGAGAPRCWRLSANGDVIRREPGSGTEAGAGDGRGLDLQRLPGNRIQYDLLERTGAGPSAPATD